MMGGEKKEQFFGYQPEKQDLLDRNPQFSPPQNASDSYTQRYFERKNAEDERRRRNLMGAIERLGMVKEADWVPKDGVIPRVPYRAPEQEFGF